MVEIKSLKYNLNSFNAPLFYEFTFGTGNKNVYAEDMCTSGCYAIDEKSFQIFQENILGLIKDWKHRYPTDPQEIMDEPDWHLKITFDNGKKSYYNGGVARPANLEEFEDYIKAFYDKVTKG